MTVLLSVLALGASLAMAFTLLRRDSRFPHDPPDERAPERRDIGTVSTLWFPACDGARLEGWLFRPHASRAPLVVMAPGLCGTKEGFLEPFAWQFVTRGMAALIFDYRCFGGSEGTPRHWVDPARHVEDYRAALEFARTRLADTGAIDPQRIALWGSSFSGGSALVTAAEERVEAVVVQAPFLETPEHLQPKGMGLLRFAFWTTLDLLGVLPPIYVPALGRPGEWVFAPSREVPSVHDFDGPLGSDFWRMLPKPARGGWQNRMLARMLATLDRFRPMDAVPRIPCPILFVAASEDDLVPRAFVERAHAIAASPESRLEVLPCGHFDLYVGADSAPNAEIQARFLAAHFGMDVTEPSAARMTGTGTTLNAATRRPPSPE